MCDGVCFWREGGVWELTLALNNLIERHPPTLLPRREDRRGCRALRDPPLPPQQFAVWEAQRGGQRSNKCSETEVLSHDNALTNNSASFQGCWRRTAVHRTWGTLEYYAGLIINDTFEESMWSNRQLYTKLSKWHTSVNHSYIFKIGENTSRSL